VCPHAALLRLYSGLEALLRLYSDREGSILTVRARLYSDRESKNHKTNRQGGEGWRKGGVKVRQSESERAR
jgi:hypothetical protein